MLNIFKKVFFLFLSMAVLIVFPDLASALTIEEAIDLAKQHLPAYKAATLKVAAAEELAKASLGPYLPSIDATASNDRHYNSLQDYPAQTDQVSVNFTLFDGGKRRADRDIALLDLSNARADLQKTLLALEYNVKVAFYTAMIKRDSLEFKRLQLNDSEKDYEVAQGRYKYGLAKLSDTLQSDVRLQQAKYNVIASKTDYEKALADLDSLIGAPSDSKPFLEGPLVLSSALPSINTLYRASLKKPEITETANDIDIARAKQASEVSAFWPTVSAQAAYVKTEGGVPGTLVVPEDRTLGISASWNIFDLGKFYRTKSAAISVLAAKSTFAETKRTLMLAVQKAYEDFAAASGKLSVAQGQLKAAEHNYALEFGEYKIGEADILALVQAESLLAEARDQMISAKLDIITARAQLENLSGVPSLESLSLGQINKPSPLK